MTGFSPAVRKVIREREGRLCARCSGHGAQCHHRRPLGMGGDSRESTNRAANGLYLCVECHQTVTEHPAWGRVFGYLVPQNVEPAEVVVYYRGRWVYLDDDGGLNEAIPDGDLMKTTLTAEDRGKVWRAVEPSWLHYRWLGDEWGHWECYPCDPRTNPGVTNHSPAHLNDAGLIERVTGLVEAAVPDGGGHE